ncbi:MAG: DUF4956 domain-containing protein [Planctomycetales bacterium]|nr:DUF4956 domain-containing protein [Planctomycetales bacterium]
MIEIGVGENRKMQHWVELLLYGDMGSTPGGAERLVFILVMSFVVGQLIAWIYMWTHKVLSYSQTFVASLVIMPVIVALMMSLITGSMFIAFGLLAVFAVVRFRNVLKDTRDTTYVLWAIVEGMAIGTQRFSSAWVGAVGIAFVFVYLRITSFGTRNQFDVVLNLFWVGDMEAAGALKPLLRRHSSRIQLVSQRKTPGEGEDLSYRLQLRDPDRSHELQTELEQFPGVDRVAVFVRDDESEV